MAMTGRAGKMVKTAAVPLKHAVAGGEIQRDDIIGETTWAI